MESTTGLFLEGSLIIPKTWLVQGFLRRFSGPLSGNGPLALFDQMVVSGTNFLTGVIVGRACSKEEFGLYMLGLSIVVLATDIQTSLISSPYMVQSPHLKGQAHSRYTGSIMFHQFGLSALTVLALVGGGAWLSTGNGPPGLAPVIWSLVLVISFILLREHARRVCFANLDFRTAVIIDLCVGVSQIVILGWLAFRGRLEPGSVFLVVGIAGGIAALAWLLRTRGSLSFNLSSAISDFYSSWTFGKWIFASGLLWTLSMNLYPWVLTLFHGTGSTGIWAACLGIFAIGNPFLFGLANYLGPRLAHSYADGGVHGLRALAIKGATRSTALMVPLVVFLVGFGGALVELVYGQRYAGNGLVVSILALNLLAMTPSVAFSRSLLVLGRADIDFRANLVVIVILVFFGVPAVQALGPLGVALSLFVSNFAASALKFFMLSRLIKSLIPEEGS